jgi:hypothetical protein
VGERQRISALAATATFVGRSVETIDDGSVCVSHTTCNTSCNGNILQQLRLEKSNARRFEVNVLHLYAVL